MFPAQSPLWAALPYRERLKAYLKKNNLKQKQFIIGLIEDALEQDEEDSNGNSETEEPDEPDMDAEEE